MIETAPISFDDAPLVIVMQQPYKELLPHAFLYQFWSPVVSPTGIVPQVSAHRKLSLDDLRCFRGCQRSNVFVSIAACFVRP